MLTYNAWFLLEANISPRLISTLFSSSSPVGTIWINDAFSKLCSIHIAPKLIRAPFYHNSSRTTIWTKASGPHDDSAMKNLARVRLPSSWAASTRNSHQLLAHRHKHNDIKYYYFRRCFHWTTGLRVVCQRSGGLGSIVLIDMCDNPIKSWHHSTPLPSHPKFLTPVFNDCQGGKFDNSPPVVGFS